MSSTRWTRAGPGSPRGRASPPRDRRRPQRRRRPRDARARRAPGRPRGEQACAPASPRARAGRDRRRRRLGRRGAGPAGLGTRAEREERVVHPAVSCPARCCLSARSANKGVVSAGRDADGMRRRLGGNRAARRARRAAPPRAGAYSESRADSGDAAELARVAAKDSPAITAAATSAASASARTRDVSFSCHSAAVLCSPARRPPAPAARRVAASARPPRRGRLGARRRLLGVGGASLRLGQASRRAPPPRCAAPRAPPRYARRPSRPAHARRPARLCLGARSASSRARPSRARAFPGCALALLHLDARAHRQPELVLALHAAHGVLLVLDARDRHALRLDQRAAAASSSIASRATSASARAAASASYTPPPPPAPPPTRGRASSAFASEKARAGSRASASAPARRGVRPGARAPPRRRRARAAASSSARTDAACAAYSVARHPRRAPLTRERLARLRLGAAARRVGRREPLAVPSALDTSAASASRRRVDDECLRGARAAGRRRRVRFARRRGGGRRGGRRGNARRRERRVRRVRPGIGIGRFFPSRRFAGRRGAFRLSEGTREGVRVPRRVLGDGLDGRLGERARPRFRHVERREPKRERVAVGKRQRDDGARETRVTRIFTLGF